MKYHDYSLEGYSVRKHGAHITLYLSLGSELSEIEFSDVILHHIIQTGGAVITDIAEVPVARLVLEKKDMISEWWRQHGGIQHWNDDPTCFSSTLASLGYRSWSIGSAIGFEAFIIGKDIRQK
jgi:hypothetical protein